MQRRYRILIVDDEPEIRLLLAKEIAELADVDTASNAEEAMEKCRSADYDVMATDIRMPGMSGLDLAAWVKREKPGMDVVVMTGYATIDAAATAVRLGAFDFLLKPFEHIDLIGATFRRAIDKRRLQDERRQAQEDLQLSQQRLAQAQKMEALGCLAGVVAHHFNNLLTGIMVRADMLQAGLEDGDARKADVEGILKLSTKATALTAKLLAISSAQVLVPATLRVDELLEQTCSALRRALAVGVQLVTAVASDAGRIHVDGDRFQEVLFTLAMSAEAGMAEGGTLRIDSNVVELSREDCLAYPGLRPGRHVRVSVGDTAPRGEGQRGNAALEPVLGPQPANTDSGLGLSAAYGFIKQSGGHLTTDESGATYSILFPQVQP